MYVLVIFECPLNMNYLYVIFALNRCMFHFYVLVICGFPSDMYYLYVLVVCTCFVN